MTIDDKIKNEKLPFVVNREAAKIPALSSRKIDKYEYLTGEKMSPSAQSRVIEQAQFTFCPLGKALEKQIKKAEDQRRKQVESLKCFCKKTEHRQ